MGSAERKTHVSRPKYGCMSAVASKDCPVRSTQPQAALLVHPFSPPGHQRFDRGLEEVSVRNPAAAAKARSRSRTVIDESRMGWKWERDVIHAREVKPANNSGGQCAPGFLNDVCDDESALLPSPRGEAVTVEDVEVRKDGARLELTEPLRESVGDAAPAGGGL
jgi:hypothetical protein